MLSRYTQPVCMKDLLQRFDTVLTPPSLFKSSAARSIQLGTIDPAAVKKKYANVLMLDGFTSLSCSFYCDISNASFLW